MHRKKIRNICVNTATTPSLFSTPSMSLTTVKRVSHIGEISTHLDGEDEMSDFQDDKLKSSPIMKGATEETLGNGGMSVKDQLVVLMSSIKDLQSKN